MANDYFVGDDRTNRERMLAGDLYVADDPDNARLVQRAHELAEAYREAFVSDRQGAGRILADLLGDVADDVEVRPPLFVDYGENITIGARTFINFNLTALDVAAIRIGEDCQIGPNVVGAGSVVTKDIPPNVVAAGNPAKVIREIRTN